MKTLRLYLSLLFLLLPSVVRAQDAAPTASPSPGTPSLSVWIPDDVFPLEGAALGQLQAQVAEYAANGGGEVLLRLKAAREVGGILSSLRATAPVASASLPNVALLRRNDMLQARNDDILVPLETRLPASNAAALTDVLRLGQADGELYGVPYLLELGLTLYQAERANAPALDWAYAALLEREQSLLFAAGQPNGISPLFYVQYIAAGGRSTDTAESLAQDALRPLLAYYADAQAAGLIAPNVLSYVSYQEALAAFEAEPSAAYIANSTLYLSLQAQMPRLRIAPIPSAEGAPAALLDGWLWVIITQDEAETNEALRLLGWLLDVERQAALAEAAGVLPSEREALRRAYADVLDVEAAQQLIEAATLVQNEGEGGTFWRAMHEAVARVLANQATAAQALEALLPRSP